MLNFLYYYPWFWTLNKTNKTNKQSPVSLLNNYQKQKQVLSLFISYFFNHQSLLAIRDHYAAKGVSAKHNLTIQIRNYYYLLLLTANERKMEEQSVQELFQDFWNWRLKRTPEFATLVRISIISICRCFRHEWSRVLYLWTRHLWTEQTKFKHLKRVLSDL
jgi:hypothetical protein